MIRFGPAGAPRWFDQRLDRLEPYLDHIVAHGAGSIEFVVHGGAPGGETERVHLSQPNWIPAISAAQIRGLDVHLHAPLTPGYRLNRWSTDRAGIIDLFVSIIGLLVDTECDQTRPPVLVLHAATFPQGSPDEGQVVTAEFVTWLAESLQRKGSHVQIAIELRLRTDPDDSRFDRQLSSLVRFAKDLDLPNLGVCWDIANFLESELIDALPTAAEIQRINHVHLHDRHPRGGGLHAPLDASGLRWQRAVRLLRTVGWSGAITLEIRYRYVLERGQPWNVLAESLDQLRRLLTEE